jgi:hypothetical protein
MAGRQPDYVTINASSEGLQRESNQNLGDCAGFQQIAALFC